MSRKLVTRLLVFATFVGLGWWLAGLRSPESQQPPVPKQSEADGAVDPSRYSAAPRERAATINNPSRSNGPASSPILRMERWLHTAAAVGGGTLQVRPNTNLFSRVSPAVLGHWLGLEEESVTTLGRILERAARQQAIWEAAHVGVSRNSDGSLIMIWPEPLVEHAERLRADLLDAFGAELARLVWIRGDLNGFFDPLPEWSGRSTDEIVFRHALSESGEREFIVTNGSFNVSRTLREDYGGPPVPDRFRHLLRP